MEKIPQKHIVYKYLRYNIQINKGGVPNERQKNKTETRAHGQTIPILALKAKKNNNFRQTYQIRFIQKSYFKTTKQYFFTQTVKTIK